MDNLQLDSLQLTCERKAELPDIAQKILGFADNIKVLIFAGELGAGKTTLIKELCIQLGVGDAIASPTFSIVNEYKDVTGNSVYHFDFYRIKNEEEAVDIGVEEYFYSGDYCFIEWPEKIERLLPEALLLVRIESGKGEKRIFNLTRYE
ncbi:MAG: tRNA (adenosine(37)-N6)-threonylcarbamoyltransferase complex ATPase subunit type 1 TsaE [Cyclobacteriaceae bacterium]|nr:tRNA (adenosine(37)-N6)-threonylcarbamoyltransferase complex ATPase subunit type 1 TsaE [Cyclobacteriaceae bacterium]